MSAELALTATLEKRVVERTLELDDTQRVLHRMWWLGWHLNGVCLLFAATHDSFISLGLRSLFPAMQNPTTRSLVFVSVLTVAAVARWWLGRRYLKGDRARSASPRFA